MINITISTDLADDELAHELDSLAGTAIASLPFDAQFEDLSFGPLAGISRAMRAIETAEGLTLEVAARLILSREAHLLVAEPGAQFALPADLVARHGDRAQMRNCYAPDLIVLDTERHHLVIAEFKRSGTSFNNAEIGTIRAKLGAIAPLVSTELKRARDGAEVHAVDLAVVDCTGSDKRHTLVDLGMLGELLGHRGFAPMMLHFRTCFGRHAQSALLSKFGIRRIEADEVMPSAEIEPLIRFCERPAHLQAGGR